MRLPSKPASRAYLQSLRDRAATEPDTWSTVVSDFETALRAARALQRDVFDQASSSLDDTLMLALALLDRRDAGPQGESRAPSAPRMEVLQGAAAEAFLDKIIARIDGAAASSSKAGAYAVLTNRQGDLAISLGDPADCDDLTCPVHNYLPPQDPNYDARVHLEQILEHMRQSKKFSESDLAQVHALLALPHTTVHRTDNLLVISRNNSSLN